MQLGCRLARTISDLYFMPLIVFNNSWSFQGYLGEFHFYIKDLGFCLQYLSILN